MEFYAALPYGSRRCRPKGAVPAMQAVQRIVKRLRQLYHASSLKTKLSVLVLAAFLPVMVLCQSFLYLRVEHSVEQNARNAADITATQIQTTLGNHLRGLVERLYYIYLDPTFEDALNDFLLTEPTAATRSVAQSLLSPCLSLHKASEPLISALFLYTPEGSFTDLGLSSEKSYRFEDSVLWEQLQNSSATMTWGEAYTDEIFTSHRAVIPLMYRFRIEGYSKECILLANIDQSKLTRYLSQTISDDASGLIILDANGTPVTNAVGPAALLLEQPETLAKLPAGGHDVTPLRLGGSTYLATQRELSISSWRVVYLHAADDYYAGLAEIQTVFWLVSLAAAAGILLLVMRIVRSVTAPLSQLSESMHQAELQNEPKPFDYPYDNEVGKLAKRYNSLLAHNATLLQEQESYIEQLRDEKEQLRVEQQLKRRAELKALQAQINPHFLYNTLDSIHWKAEIAGVPEISEMTMALATLFRIGLSRGHEIITLAQELQYVDSYLQIQKFRYGDRLNYRVDIPQELRSLYTVKLILQPLVENAIYHGIKEKDEPGMIAVTGRRDGDVLVLQVADDGLGIPPERLAMLQADLKRGLVVSNDGYGIFNVNERIRLHFGPEYGLTLDSAFERGTLATVRLPCMTEEDAERYVSLTDR